nr:3-deoxy-manno-octulosonate cytidylyltransferase [Isosphaera pallida]
MDPLGSSTHCEFAPEGSVKQMKTVGIIPARYASTRLPGKPLLSETGRPLIVHVLDAAARARRLDQVIVATDDLRIAQAVTDHGGRAVLTRSDHPTGSDRVAEVAAQLTEVDLIVNLQGDEPEVAGASIDLLVDLLADHPEVPMATLAAPIVDRAVYDDPSCVKVVRAANGRALYFSRAPIPHHRDAPSLRGVTPEHPWGLLHIGIYAYRREFLLGLAQVPPSPLEETEKLEQLRVLEAGHPILVGVVPERSVGIDTPEDYRRFVERWRAGRVQAA